jgi:hypothetical protein
MLTTSTEYRLAENESFFRELNEKTHQSMDTINENAKADGVRPIRFDEDMPLNFYCECSDENCKERVNASLAKYRKIHAAQDRFIISHGHEVKEIEDVVEKNSKYTVVKKHITPPRTGNKLHVTDVDNT